MAEWNFPSNNNGQIRGYSDAGIETFNGNELESLVRETCQNSLDASNDDGKAVRVEYEWIQIYSKEIPGYQEYIKLINNCKDYWSKEKNKKAHVFLEEATRKLKKQYMYVLRISDYNTIGLAEPYGNGFEGWNSLTKVDGGSTKTGDSAGSFGIGKNAPFSQSLLRLVFYRTLNLAGERASQGMSRLLSFPKDLENPINTMTVGIGYYGEPNRNMPVQQIFELETLNKRDEIGTDVFIYGFKEGDHKGKMISEVLESFFIAIVRDKIEIKIQDDIVNSRTIGRFINQYSNSAKNAFSNYQIICDKDNVKEITKDFHGLGTLRLRVLVDPEKKLNQKVLVVRSSGMRLFHMGRISRAVSFTGILELEGVELNAYFREMENVSHDAWEPARHSDSKQARQYYKELKEWVKNEIMDLGEFTSDEEVEVEGLSDILQEKQIEAANINENEKNETLKKRIESIDINEKTHISTAIGMFYPLSDQGENNKHLEDVKGLVDNKGKLSAIRTLKGSRKRTQKTSHRGIEDPKGEDIVKKSGKNGSPCELKNARVIKIAEGKFRMIFEIPYDIREGRIELVTIGENGRKNRLNIKDANPVSACGEVELLSGSVLARKIQSGAKVKIDFNLQEPREYAMEVSVYENN